MMLPIATTIAGGVFEVFGVARPDNRSLIIYRQQGNNMVKTEEKTEEGKSLEVLAAGNRPIVTLDGYGRQYYELTDVVGGYVLADNLIAPQD